MEYTYTEANDTLTVTGLAELEARTVVTYTLPDGSIVELVKLPAREDVPS